MDRVLNKARKAAADQYDQAWPMKTTYGNQPREAFLEGWDAAMRQVGLFLQTPGADGCYCAHRPDDPAHTSACYDLEEVLINR